MYQVDGSPSTLTLSGPCRLVEPAAVPCGHTSWDLPSPLPSLLSNTNTQIYTLRLIQIQHTDIGESRTLIPFAKKEFEKKGPAIAERQAKSSFDCNSEAYNWQIWLPLIQIVRYLWHFCIIYVVKLWPSAGIWNWDQNARSARSVGTMGDLIISRVPGNSPNVERGECVLNRKGPNLAAMPGSSWKWYFWSF